MNNDDSTANEAIAGKQNGISPARVYIWLGREVSSANAGIVLAKALVNAGMYTRFVGSKSARVQGVLSSAGFSYDQIDLDGMPPWAYIQDIRAFGRAHVMDLLVVDSLVGPAVVGYLTEWTRNIILMVPNYSAPLSPNWPQVSEPFNNPTSEVPPPTRFEKVRSNLREISRFVHLARRAVREAAWQTCKGVAHRSFLSWCDDLLTRNAVRIARQRGFQFHATDFKPRLAISEIVIGHRRLDWDALQRAPGRLYLSGIRAIAEEAGHRGKLAQAYGGKLVYCNVSTLFGDLDTSNDSRVETVRRLILCLREAARKNSSATFVVSGGKFAKEIGSLENFRVLEWVDQVDLISRASLVITQGGAGTIRECINFGVPMIVAPLWWDQFGNSARVASRGLGHAICMERVTSESLTELVASALQDAALRDRAREFHEQCLADSLNEETALLAKLKALAGVMH